MLIADRKHTFLRDAKRRCGASEFLLWKVWYEDWSRPSWMKWYLAQIAAELRRIFFFISSGKPDQSGITTEQSLIQFQEVEKEEEVAAPVIPPPAPAPEKGIGPDMLKRAMFGLFGYKPKPGDL